MKAYRAGVVTEPKTKLRRGERQKKLCAGRQWAVSAGVAIKVGEPKMGIDAEAAEEVDADERLRLVSPRRRHQRLL